MRESSTGCRNENLLAAFLLFLLLLVFSVPFVFSGRMYVIWLREDGILESLSALYWMLAAVLSFVLFAAVKSGNDFIAVKTRRNVFFLLLGIVFLCGFGEEISWGQRLFGLETPEPLSKINSQNEINLHNIDVLDIDGLFSVFWFLYCFVLPLTVRLIPRLSALFSRINLPMVPLVIGVFFPINYLISKPLEPLFTGAIHNTPIELKEHNFAMLFFVLLVCFVRRCFPHGRLELRN